jgi:hypothetical protein
MKKASKFLSMFLLVAMCLSFMTVAAYADSYSDSYSGTVVANNNANNTVVVLGGTDSASTPAMYSSAELVWKSGNYEYRTLAEIIAVGTSITLQSNASDGGVTLEKAYVINLNGNTWTVSDDVYVNTSMTIKNGTIENPSKIHVTKGTLTASNVKVDGNDAKATDFSVATGAAVKIDNSVDPVAKIGSTGYATAEEAFAYAATQTGTVTITFPDYTETVATDDARYKVTGTYTLGCDLNLVLNKNLLDISEATLNLNGNVSVSGYKLVGDITVNAKNVTLANATNVDGTITDTYGTVTVKGGTVKAIELTDGTLVMSSGEVNALTINGENNTLSVGGGTIGTADNNVTVPANFKSAAVTGGNWYIDGSDAQIAYLKLNANNRTVTKNDTYGYYTVGTGTGTVINGNTSSNTSSSSGDSYSQVAGSYTVNGFTYTTTTSGDVAVWPVSTATWTSGNGNLYFYYTPNTAAANGLTYHFYLDSTSWQIPGESYTDNLAGTMSIGKAQLANLSEGTHTLYFVCDGNVASCTFYVAASLKAIDTDKHVINSTKTLSFLCSQPISKVAVGGQDITSYNGTYYTLSSDRKTITLTADFLNARTAGNTYTLTVTTDNGDQPSATFQILTTAQASSSPKTGDTSNLALWAAVLVLSGGAAVAVLPRLKKNEG